MTEENGQEITYHWCNDEDHLPRGDSYFCGKTYFKAKTFFFGSKRRVGLCIYCLTALVKDVK